MLNPPAIIDTGNFKIECKTKTSATSRSHLRTKSFHNMSDERFGTFHSDCGGSDRSEEHTSELQSRPHLVCRLLLEKKKKKKDRTRQNRIQAKIPEKRENTG